MTEGATPDDEAAPGRIVLDGRPLPFEPDDSVAIAILRERVSRSHLVGIALTALAIVLIGVGSATL